jgi:hypothetical protein
MRWKAEGKSLAEIRAAVDAKYLQFGPPTPTPRPPGAKKL